MAKTSIGLTARISALEKTIAEMFAGKKTKRKSVPKKAPAKRALSKSAKKTRRKTAKSLATEPTIEMLVPGGEPLFVTPMDQV